MAIRSGNMDRKRNFNLGVWSLKANLAREQSETKNDGGNCEREIYGET